MVGVGVYNMAGASDCKIIGPKFPVVVILIVTLWLSRVCGSLDKADGTFSTSILYAPGEAGDSL
jgi:hypothetical protein